MTKNRAERRIDLPSGAGRASNYTAGATGASGIAAHSHDGTASSGGVIDYSVINDILLMMMVKTSVADGDTLTIPTGWQQLIWGAYTVDGTLEISGEMVIL